MKKTLGSAAFILLIIITLAASASADPVIYSGSMVFDLVASGGETSQDAINDIIDPLLDAEDAEMLYYNDWKDPEDGPFANSYDINVEYVDGVNNAVISFENTPAIANPDFLLIKDGKSDIAWYLYDISGWDGMANIFIEGFWPGKSGAFSHMTIYGGGDGFETPEPGSLILLGTGLLGLGLGIWRRKA